LAVLLKATIMKEDMLMVVGKHIPAIRKWLNCIAGEVEPVVVAFNVAGLAGGAIAAAGMLTSQALRNRSRGDIWHAGAVLPEPRLPRGGSRPSWP
jgi:hypothetical protein